MMYPNDQNLENSFFFYPKYPSYSSNTITKPNYVTKPDCIIKPDYVTKPDYIIKPDSKNSTIISECPNHNKTSPSIPVSIVCPHCNNSVTTTIKAEIGKTTLVSCVALSFVFLCWFPFLVDSFKDMVHYCPKCNHKIEV